MTDKPEVLPWMEEAANEINDRAYMEYEENQITRLSNREVAAVIATHAPEPDKPHEWRWHCPFCNLKHTGPVELREHLLQDCNDMKAVMEASVPVQKIKELLALTGARTFNNACTCLLCSLEKLIHQAEAKEQK